MQKIQRNDEIFVFICEFRFSLGFSPSAFVIEKVGGSFVSGKTEIRRKSHFLF